MPTSVQTARRDLFLFAGAGSSSNWTIPTGHTRRPCPAESVAADPLNMDARISSIVALLPLPGSLLTSKKDRIPKGTTTTTCMDQAWNMFQYWLRLNTSRERGAAKNRDLLSSPTVSL